MSSTSSTSTPSTTTPAPPAQTRTFLAGASLAGAQGFAIAFAAMGLLTRIVTINITDPNLTLALGTILYGAAGALGAAYLASHMHWRHLTLLFTLGGILGCGGGYLLTSILLTSHAQPQISNRTVVEAFYIAQHAIIGGILGLVLGVAFWNPKKIAFLIIAGAIGFGIGYLMQASLNDLLSGPLSELVGKFTQSASINLIAASLLWGLGSLLCGLLGVGVLGYALEF